MQLTMKHEGMGFIVWSLILANKLGWLCEIECNLNKEFFMQYLDDGSKTLDVFSFLQCQLGIPANQQFQAHIKP
jgi:hypothetical protein